MWQFHIRDDNYPTMDDITQAQNSHPNLDDQNHPTMDDTTLIQHSSKN